MKCAKEIWAIVGNTFTRLIKRDFLSMHSKNWYIFSLEATPSWSRAAHDGRSESDREQAVPYATTRS
jgi:hypothetical protein